MKKDLALKDLPPAPCAAQSPCGPHPAGRTLRNPPAGLIHHSDRGSQYCSDDYRRELRNHGFIASMSGKGNCYDNAMVEAVFKTIKAELVWTTIFQTRHAAEKAIGTYIDGFYNPRRRHSALGYKAPIIFEAAGS